MTPEQQEASPNAEGELGPHERGASLERVLALRPELPVQENVIAFKFGGSSLLGAERLLHSARLVQDAARTRPVTAVVSAMKASPTGCWRLDNRSNKGEIRRRERKPRPSRRCIWRHCMTCDSRPRSTTGWSKNWSL